MTEERLDPVVRVDAPVPGDVLDELLPFWWRHFDEEYGHFRTELGGSETEENLESVYTVRAGGRLVGALRMCVSRSNPELAGLGVVATDPEYRGRGIATAICGQAVEDFRAGGGRCVFLVAGEPGPRRIYHRLGWRKMGGTGVMGCVTGDDSPEEFLVDYFRVGGRATIRPGTAWERVPMIPLHVTPHDWQVLDGNIGEFSTRYWSWKYCNTLYPAYERLAADGRGAWFVARTDTNRLVGLSSARMTDGGRCSVDGFAHHRYMDAWSELIEAAAGWGAWNGASVIETRLSVEDGEKREKMSSLGFVESREGEEFDLDDGRTIPSVVAERKV